MSDHTTAETRQTFRCKECVSKDADIARLTVATRKVVEAGRSLEGGLDDFWVTTEEGQAIFHAWKTALADPVIVGLRKEE